MADAVNNWKKNKRISQKPLFLIISNQCVWRYGSSSASIPPNFWMSSVFCCSIWSKISSIVTIPTKTPASVTIGSAVLSYFSKYCTASSLLVVVVMATKWLSVISEINVSSSAKSKEPIAMSSMSWFLSSTT